MRHACSFAVLLAFTALAAYVAGSRPVQAQSEQSPFSSGDVLTLTFPGGATQPCTIEDVKGTFVRCGTGQRQPLSIGQRERPEEWVNLSQVQEVSRRRPGR
jgi:hypothetical protein